MIAALIADADTAGGCAGSGFGGRCSARGLREGAAGDFESAGRERGDCRKGRSDADADGRLDPLPGRRDAAPRGD
jgi:hypothetical protein